MVKRFIPSVFFIGMVISGFSQKSLYRKAEKHFNRFEFVGAAHLYEKIVRKHPNDEAASARLEQCYNALSYRTLQVREMIQAKSGEMKTTEKPAVDSKR